VFTIWLLGDHLLLRDFGPYGIIFMNVCVVITVAMVILLQDLGPYVVNIYDCVFTTLNCSVIHGQMPSYFLILFYCRVQGFTKDFPIRILIWMFLSLTEKLHVQFIAVSCVHCPNYRTVGDLNVLNASQHVTMINCLFSCTSNIFGNGMWKFGGGEKLLWYFKFYALSSITIILWHRSPSTIVIKLGK
jgi:hypothetical protein